MNESNVVLAKLDNLQRCVHRIEQKFPSDLKELQADLDIQDIVSLNLQRAIQSCVDACSVILSWSEDQTPDSMAQSFELLQRSEILSKNVADNMIKAVGLRNLLVHEYESVDWKIIYHVVQNNLKDFRQFAAEIVKWLEKSKD